MADTSNKRTGFGAIGAKATFDKLKTDRAPYETRAQTNAEYTIPSLFPKDSDGGSTDYTTPWQSVGARGLNNLASKLMLALFPQQTWMRLTISEYSAKQIVTSAEQLTIVDEGLSMVERIIMNFVDSNAYRVVLFEALKQLIVAGNALLYVPEPEGDYNPLRMYKLYGYVVQRDAYGKVLQIVTVDKIAFQALPQDVRNTLDATKYTPEQEIEVYTHVYLDDTSEDTYKKYEEIEGTEVAGTDGEYPADSLPYIPIRMVRQDGEDYGRSYVEEYLGDLKSTENLQASIVKMAMITSKVVGLVNPAGITQVRRLNKATTGDWVAGRKEDVDFLQLDKQADFSIAKQVSDTLEARLSFAFMLNSAVQRTGERVTAEEIRYVASELEDTLGGVYSILTQELQLPLVKVLLRQLQATSKIPNLPKEAVNPTIATGLSALGRGQDLEKLTQFASALGSLAPLAQDPDINMSNLKLRIANALGIDTQGLLLSQEDKQALMAQQGVQTLSQNAAAAVGQGVGAQATSSPEAMQQAASNVGINV